MTAIRELLAGAGKRIPAMDAEILLGHLARKDRLFLLAHPETPVSFRTVLRYRHAVRRRQHGMPLAVLTGRKEFFGLDFLVTRHTLIPRPETELLVERVLEKIRSQKSEVKNFLLIDVGTGSGCIPIAILASSPRSAITAIAIDASKPALAVARQNAEQHGTPIQFLHGNLLDPLKNKKLEIKNHESMIITANLPYLTPEQYAQESSLWHEPKSALIGGPTGLETYEKLLRGIAHLRTTVSVPLTIFFEIDPSQSERIKTLVKTYLPEAAGDIAKDLAGNDRVITAIIPPPKSVQPATLPARR